LLVEFFVGFLDEFSSTARFLRNFAVAELSEFDRFDNVTNERLRQSKTSRPVSVLAAALVLPAMFVAFALFVSKPPALIVALVVAPKWALNVAVSIVVSELLPALGFPSPAAMLVEALLVPADPDVAFSQAKLVLWESKKRATVLKTQSLSWFRPTCGLACLMAPILVGRAVVLIERLPEAVQILTAQTLIKLKSLRNPIHEFGPPLTATLMHGLEVMTTSPASHRRHRFLEVNSSRQVFKGPGIGVLLHFGRDGQHHHCASHHS
jgi:hypothetical protein